MKISVQDVMEKSGVGFGTSGARGLSDDMTDRVCWIYTRGFLQHLSRSQGLVEGRGVAIAGDFRPSTGRIMEAVARAVKDAGSLPIHCGRIPSPAVALYGLAQQIPAIMVTGSHIPADRNGIKFNTALGEILKNDEEGIRQEIVEIPEHLFNADGSFIETDAALPTESSDAAWMYTRRYLDFFSPDCLAGVKIGVYQHSAVGRDMLVEIFRGLGGTVTPLGRSETFIPVDTEAIRAEDTALALQWSRELQLDAIVSTDGDSDRPLLAGENGDWLRGDVAGILCAKFLQADSVSTPVSCNSAVDLSGWFKEVRRTRIGSPFVIASLNEAVSSGASMAVGYEANGGFLTNSPYHRDGRVLRALPTRDAVILLVGILLLARENACSVTQLVAQLPARFTHSDRLKDFPVDKSRAVLARFSSGDSRADQAAFESVFGDLCGAVRAIDQTDGIRATFENLEVIHLRPSGNAPEFRCYNEAASRERVVALNAACMLLLKSLPDPLTAP